VGIVFKILWIEPRGQAPGSSTVVTSDFSNSMGFGYFAKIRRFVIVKIFKAHCTCLPLLTYTGLGTTKPGVNPKDHAAVFTGHKAQLAPGEAEIGLRPALRVIPNNPKEKLDPMTRLNYAKLYTVEYNVNLRFIGRVDEQSMPDLVYDYNEVHKLVWEPSQQPSSEETRESASISPPLDYSAQNLDTDATPGAQFTGPQNTGYNSYPPSHNSTSTDYTPYPPSHHSTSTDYTSYPPSHHSTSTDYTSYPPSHHSPSTGYTSYPSSHHSTSTGYSGYATTFKNFE
jgi:hypothetical protein